MEIMTLNKRIIAVYVDYTCFLHIQYPKLLTLSKPITVERLIVHWNIDYWADDTLGD